MAIFSNQAILTVNGNSTNSNIAYGEILDVLTATKTAVEGTYAPGETITYAVALRNTGAATLAGLTVTDNLGAFPFGAGTLYPLTYVDGSVTLFVNGVLQPTPAVTSTQPLVVSGISIPGAGDAVLVYQAVANEFARFLQNYCPQTEAVFLISLNVPFNPEPCHFFIIRLWIMLHSFSI